MSTTLPGIKLVVAKRFVNFIVEGPSDRFFDKLAAPLLSPGTVEGREEEIVFKATGDLCKDIAAAHTAGLTVDDENEPAPEKHPCSQFMSGTRPRHWSLSGSIMRVEYLPL